MYEGIQERGGLYSSCNAYGFASPVPDTTRLQYKLVATLQRDYITVRAGSSFTATRVRRPTNRSHWCCCNKKGVLMHDYSARLVAGLIARRTRCNG